MRAPRWMVCIASLAFLLTACAPIGMNSVSNTSGGQPGRTATSYPPPTEAGPLRDLTEVTRLTNDLGLRLLQQLHAQTPEESTVISPVSITTALAMLYNGAEGETRQQLQDLLRLGDLPPGRLNLALYSMNYPGELVGSKPEFSEMHVANSLWHDEALELQPEFDRVSQVYYRATVDSVPFGHRDAARRINAWVDEQTHGLIPAIIQETSPDDALILVNALYLKAQWIREFDAAKTQPKPFTTAEGKKHIVPMMHQEGYYNYHDDDAVQRLSLLLGDGGLKAMLLLPPADMQLTDFIASLGTEQIDQWNQQHDSRKGSLALPKLSLNFGTSLVESMQALGLSAAFKPSNDFRPIYAGASGLAVSQINHRATLTLDEKGIEAAAVTDIGLAGSAPPPEMEPFEMVLDRPFLLLIQDRHGRILFLSAVTDPGTA